MIRYLIIHNKHEGCYDFHCYQDEVARIRLTSITINPPKIYIFTTRDEAQDFFEEYINDIDCIDIRCKRGDEVEHIDYCTCGVIELDDKGEPILFYNKKNQIFLMEHGPQLFVPNYELKNDVKNFNLTNRLMRKCKSLGREQRKRYIELGKYCEECNAEVSSDDEEEKNKVIKTEEELKKDDDEIAPEFKVLKAIPTEGITLEALIYRVRDAAKTGLGICLKNNWIYKEGALFFRSTTDNIINPTKNEVKPPEQKEEVKDVKEEKKPKTVRKKKTDGEEAKSVEKDETKSEEKKPEEKKPRAPRKKKTDNA
jgi:hypothetical protein